jgi:hypothetical protein
MAKYGEAVMGVASVGEAIQVATELYREDLESGHITVLSELIAGSLDRPDLGPQIVERMDPWIDLAERAVRNAMSSIGLAEVVPPRTIAYAIVALYLGVDLLSHLEKDNARAEAMFASARELGDLLSRLGGDAGATNG